METTLKQIQTPKEVLKFLVPYTPERTLEMCNENELLVLAIVAKYHHAHQWKYPEAFELALDVFFENLHKPRKAVTTTGFPEDEPEENPSEIDPEIEFEIETDDEDEIEFAPDDEDDDLWLDDYLTSDCANRITHGFADSCSCGNHSGYKEVLYDP